MLLQHSKIITLITTFLFLTMLVFASVERAAELSAASPQVASQLSSIIPSEPPRADRISFSSLNDLGESTVTGAPGSVLPSAHVLLVNLDSSHQTHVISGADGSFISQIFAPPGSNIMVKHGPVGHQFWHIDPWKNIDQGSIGWLTVFPSTTIFRPFEHTTAPDSLSFAAAGGIDIGIEDNLITRTIGSAWSMIGTVDPVNDLQPGDKIDVEATIRVYSQEISGATDVSAVTLQMGDVRPWLALYDRNAKPLPYNDISGSARLTPTGFPILDSHRPEVETKVTSNEVNWQYAGGHTIEGDLTATITLNSKMPPGVYRPILNLEFQGVPAGDDWVAATTTWLSGIPSYNFNSSGAALPPLEVKPAGGAAIPVMDSNADHRLIWYLLMDNASLGTRGTGAFEDREIFQPSSFVVHQGARYVLPPVDLYTGEPAVYRLEPYLPMISYGRGAEPGPPLLPFALPGGELCVTVHEPDGQQQNLGCAAFAQSISGDRSTALGEVLNLGAIEVSEYYGLTTVDDRFALSFSKQGYHAIEMTGWVEDVWGNRYQGGGTYEVWVAHPIDLDPGLLPGTPLAVGDSVNTTVQLNPRLPAHVNVTVRHFPYSDPSKEQIFSQEGWANRFGYFAPGGSPITLDKPGEYRLDLFAEYVDPESGETFAAGTAWGGVVMTPPGDAQLVAHGRRGSDNFKDESPWIPNSWFVFCDENLEPPLLVDGTPHLLNPYLNGDVLWTYDAIPKYAEEADPPRDGCTGNALIMNSSIQDTVGTVQTAVQERYNHAPIPVSPPGSFITRTLRSALPLFSSTTNGGPVSLFPEKTDQIAYAYLSSQRPGVRVRETVSEDRSGSGYWRLDTMYDNQPGVGIEGDLPNDFKYQFVGAVYRDLESGLNEYLGQASGWFHLPYNDALGSRVMPPFSGPGNGGWPTLGGPLLTLKGKDIHMFILPTGVRPGSVLQVGDRFNFGGHLMPTLDSRVEVIVTAPSGTKRTVSGRANSIGYFYDPGDSFKVNEPGLWTTQVKIWHDGRIGSGEKVDCDPKKPFDSQLPCPSGDVLGSQQGRYSFYVVPSGSARLKVTQPKPGRLTFSSKVSPITIRGSLPSGISSPTVDYTISMPGFILKEGQAQIDGSKFYFVFDPVALSKDFPNLDLNGRYTKVAGLSDTFSIGILLSGLKDGKEIFRSATVTIQGDQVYVEEGKNVIVWTNYFLPVVNSH